MKATIYLYNYISNIMVFGSVNSSIINLNNLILNNISVGYFNLANYREYLYFRIYRCRVYIYIL